MSSPYSPKGRETKIPTPKSNRSTSQRGGVGGCFSLSHSPSRRMRSPWSGKKNLTPKSGGGVASSGSASRSSAKRSQPSPVDTTTTRSQHKQSPHGQQQHFSPGLCVGASVDMLQTGLKRTPPLHPYEQLLHHEGGTADEPIAVCATPSNGSASASRNTNNNNDGTPWLSMINQLYEQHAEEKTQLKKEVKSAKQKSRHYKEELRDNLTERLRFLEAKVMETESDISRTGSATTHTTQEDTSCSEGTSAQLQQKQQSVDAGNVEVVYETISDAQVRKRVEYLEQKLQQANLTHTFEKEHWLATLDEAAKATENGAELSKKVHGILEQVATDWQDLHEEELLTTSQAKERLEHRLQEIEQAHAKEKVHWQTETAKLKDDSRRLLRERNEYKGKLSRHKEELEKSKATLSELERKVDLCQRQTSLAQKKATQMEEMAQRVPPGQRQDNQRQDPPSPERPGSIQHQLKRAMHERDAALKEAEETCKMLEDYQIRLERDRQSYNSKLKQAEEKHEKELERRMTEFENEFVERYRNVPLSEVPHAELERRYGESVEKRNELASRMRQLQEQLSKEKCNWKLKLEGSLSENRKLLKDKENLKAQNENLREQNGKLDSQIQALGNEQKSARANWENRLEQASKEWVERLSEIQQDHRKETEELKETMKNLREYKENAETLATETRKQLDSLKEKHVQDVLEWKEREVRTSQKTLFEAKETFAVELQTVHKEIARLESEKAGLEKAVQEMEKQLQEEKENAEQFQNHHDQVVSEWEDHSEKVQSERERIEAELKVAQENEIEQNTLIADYKHRTIELEKETKRLESELQTATEKAKEMERALDEVLDEHDEASLVQRENAEQHEIERKEWETERDDLKAQISNLEHRVVVLQTDAAKIRTLEEDVAIWKQKLIKAATERDCAKAELTLLESHGAQIEVWKSKSDRLQTELVRTIEWRDKEGKQAADRIESLEEENEELRIISDDLQKELEEIKSTSSKVDKKKYDSLVVENEKLVGVNEDQRRQLEDWTNKVEKLEDSWFRRIEQLRGELKNMEKAKDNEKEETRRIRKRLEDEREVWDREVNDLKAERAELEKVRDVLKAKLRETKKAKAEMDRSIGVNSHGIAELKALHAGEVQELKNELESLRRECDAKVANGRANFEKEINEWKQKAMSAKEEFQQQLEATRSAHENDSRGLKQKLVSADEDIASFVRQTNKLTTSLDQLQRAHDDAKRHWQNEVSRIKAENERLEGLLKSDKNVWRTHTSSLQQHQHSISTLVDAIRGDVKSVKALVETTIDKTKGASSFNPFQEDLESLRESLDRALSTMSNETQALLEHRDQMQALTEASARADEAHKRFSEQQDRLVSEIQALRDQVSRGDGDSIVLDKVRLELVEELHRKETELAKKAADLHYLREELTREQQMRERAEQEILTLNDQADAYGEELMRLQAVNKTLEETMHDFEDTVFNSDLDGIVPKRSKAEDEQSLVSDASSPMLDEALALAQSLTDLVHGSGSEEQETSVMAMLETISDMMDEHDKGKAVKGKKPKRNVPDEVAVKSRPRHGVRTRLEDQRDGHLEAVLSPNEAEPLPVTSPPGRSFFGEEQPSHLSVVVNELYARCHLLERERTQMMESTLELLQAARNANEAELEAALSTARRKSAEELLRVQEESQRGMWRMYNNLCSFCRDDVAVLEEEKKEIM